MTPYQRIKGKPWTIALPAFGECVEYKKRTRHKLEDRWDTGIYLGVKHDTTERIVGTSTGCYVVQSIRRVPEDRRYDSQLLANVKGLPWKPVPDGPEDQGVMELPEPVNLEVRKFQHYRQKPQMRDNPCVDTISRHEIWKSTGIRMVARLVTPCGPRCPGLAFPMHSVAGRRSKKR